MRYLTLIMVLLIQSCGRPEPIPPLMELHFPSAATPTAPDLMLDYSRRAIQLCTPPGHLSEAAAEVLAVDVAHVATTTFPQDETRSEAFVAMLCIESQFDQGAHSPVGATGIAQLMPQYLQDFAHDCGLGKVQAADINSLQINLQLGACHFRKVLESVDGNIPLALASYNAGSNSKTLTALKKGGNGAEETDGYIARHYVVTQKLRKEEKK